MILGHIVTFVLLILVVWFFAGLLIKSVDAVAKRYNYKGFTVAFFVLGFLTSISEISVMINATITGVPQLSAGNLAGASIVLLLFVIPLLALSGKGIRFKQFLDNKSFALALLVIGVPALLMVDGVVTRGDGIIALLMYSALLYRIQRKRHSVPDIVETVAEDLVGKIRATTKDVAIIVAGGIVIFITGSLLVKEGEFFATILKMPSSVIGLLMLSIGTNIPEIVIAVRSIVTKKGGIALGNYIGSAVANTLAFAALALFNGSFALAQRELLLTGIITAIGFAFLYSFARSKQILSKSESYVLLGIYVVFIIFQII